MAKIKQMNEKFGPPTFPIAKGMPLEGIDFTSSKATLRTFWGPLQRRDDRWFLIDTDPHTQAYLGYHFEPLSHYFDPIIGGTFSHTWEYSKPLDWRPKSSLLTPPQVIHLCINVFGAYNNADTTAANIRLGSAASTENPDSFQYVTFFDAATAEQVRLVAACKEAAEIINGIRQGKTWVQVFDYQEGSIDNGGLTYPFDIDFPGNDHANVQNIPFDQLISSPGETPMLSVPNPFVKPFYGTDFLQIYLGDQPFELKFLGVDTLYPTYYETPMWRFMSDAVIKTAPLFHRYSSRLYASDVGTNLYIQANKQYTDAGAWLASIPSLPMSPYSTTYASHPIYFNGEAIEIQDYPDDLEFYFWTDPSGGAVIPPTEAFVLNAKTVLPSLSVYSLISQWSDENGYDVGLGGAASGMTTEAIVNAIAKHYNFNATTGADL